MAGFRGAPAPAPRREAKPETQTVRVVVPFEDNRLLPRLLGEYDSHLALIEDRLGINAHAHGNVIILTGARDASGSQSHGESLYPGRWGSHRIVYPVGFLGNIGSSTVTVAFNS